MTMMADIALAAAGVASLIADAGDIVTLADSTTIRAIVDEHYDSIRREVGVDRLEEVRARGGRVALFYLTGADAARIPPGTTLLRHGVRWAPEPAREVSAADTPVIVTLLATAGAVA